ncbi:hypothetical protein DH2020_048195 [Rehmannia glutinosa]|uniref:NAD(P)-binding domain-containing protein n=1 Tax=Rehmannia glutinosa TaxID=99300 RepID=A0ABR0U6C1_REHGL
MAGSASTVSLFNSSSLGPKLRKWYGAPDLLPKDGKELGEDEAAEEEEVRDAVLVTDGDNEIGQMIILSLILKRIRIKALVKDKRVALEAFGTYVESMAGDTKDTIFLKKALRGVRAVICPIGSRITWNSTGIQAVMNSNVRKLAEQDENVVKASGVPYSIIRTGILNNTPGGQQGFSFEEGCAAKGSLSKEDAAFICVEALDNVPQKGLIFEVVNGGEKVSDWKECFATLMDRTEAGDVSKARGSVRLVSPRLGEACLRRLCVCDEEEYKEDELFDDDENYIEIDDS